MPNEILSPAADIIYSFGAMPAAAIVGWIVSWITDYLKKLGIPAKVALIGLSLFSGLVFAVFKIFAPIEIQTRIIEFWQMVLGSSVVIYKFFREASMKEEQTNKIEKMSSQKLSDVPNELEP